MKGLKYIWLLIIFCCIGFLLLHIVQIIETNGIEGLNFLEQQITDEPFNFSRITEKGIEITAFALIVIIIMYLSTITGKKTLRGKEHGSAEWATKKDSRELSDYIDINNNIILTKTESISIDSRKVGNVNIFVVGGPGSGKTRFFIKPNIMQMNSSYVVMDPKGEILRATGKMMEDNGYVVKVLNLVNMECSNCYNPFEYIREDKDVLKIINLIMKNTTPAGQQSSDPFWEKAESALLQALVFYLFNEAPVEERNFRQIMILIRQAEVKEDNENYISKLDVLFDRLKGKDPDHIAVKQYRIFKQAAGKTAKTILVSVGVRLAVFNLKSISKLTMEDTIELKKIGSQKTILYVIMPDADHTFNFIAAMLFTQLIDTLYYQADFFYNGSLPIPVRFKMDEFPNIGILPNFDRVLATCRSRKISFSIIIQSLPQIGQLYKNNWGSIIGNCDIFLFLGGQEQSTLEYVSKYLGKSTIHGNNSSTQRGKNSSSSVSEYTVGRELMTPDEVRRLERDKCVLIISGIKPFLSKKYDIEKHKNYHLSGDSDDNNMFNIHSVRRLDEIQNDKDNKYNKLLKKTDDNDDEEPDELEFEKKDDIKRSVNTDKSR